MQQTLLWVKTWTAVWVIVALGVAFLIGAVSRVLVRRSSIYPAYALRVIESASVIAGGAVGSVIVLVIFRIAFFGRRQATGSSIRSCRIR